MFIGLVVFVGAVCLVTAGVFLLRACFEKTKD